MAQPHPVNEIDRAAGALSREEYIARRSKYLELEVRYYQQRLVIFYALGGAFTLMTLMIIVARMLGFYIQILFFGINPVFTICGFSIISIGYFLYKKSQTLAAKKAWDQKVAAYKAAKR